MIAAPRWWRVVERSVIAYRRNWLILLSGFGEPLFYLLGVGYGVGGLVGSVGHLPYAVFVAPALMATSAMNGAIYDSTFNLFFKLKVSRVYDAILSTPLTPRDVAAGEIAWALTRGTIYAAGFLLMMVALGLARGPWSVLALPAAMLIGLAFAAVGCAATTYMRWWTDFDKVTLAQLPLFLFSGTFFPIDGYPAAVRWVVEVLPLYRGVHLLRGLTTGAPGPSLLLDAGYLAALGVVGLAVMERRLSKLLLR